MYPFFFSKVYLMILECEEGVFLYRLGGGRLAHILGKPHMQPPPRALNATPEKSGSRPS
jgi:hypothetical protein